MLLGVALSPRSIDPVVFTRLPSVWPLLRCPVDLARRPQMWSDLRV